MIDFVVYFGFISVVFYNLHDYILLQIQIEKDEKEKLKIRDEVKPVSEPKINKPVRIEKHAKFEFFDNRQKNWKICNCVLKGSYLQYSCEADKRFSGSIKIIDLSVKRATDLSDTHGRSFVFALFSNKPAGTKSSVRGGSAIKYCFSCASDQVLEDWVTSIRSQIKHLSSSPDHPAFSDLLDVPLSPGPMAGAASSLNPLPFSSTKNDNASGSRAEPGVGDKKRRGSIFNRIRNWSSSKGPQEKEDDSSGNYANRNRSSSAPIAAPPAHTPSPSQPPPPAPFSPAPSLVHHPTHTSSTHSVSSLSFNSHTNSLSSSSLPQMKHSSLQEALHKSDSFSDFQTISDTIDKPAPNSVTAPNPIPNPTIGSNEGTIVSMTLPQEPAAPLHAHSSGQSSSNGPPRDQEHDDDDDSAMTGVGVGVGVGVGTVVGTGTGTDSIGGVGQTSKWDQFLFPGEQIVATSLIGKRNKLGINKKRQLILTSVPRLFYVDPSSMEITGAVRWINPMSERLDKINPFTFRIRTEDKEHKFNDNTRGAQYWIDAISKMDQRINLISEKRQSVTIPTTAKDLQDATTSMNNTSI